MNVKRKLLNAVALLAMFSAFEANAQLDTEDINVSATVDATCVIDGGAIDFDFGTIDTSVATDTVASRTFDWRCSNGTNAFIRMDAGDTAGSTQTLRLLTDGTDTINYRLCQDAACGTVWGDGTTGDELSVTGSGTGAADADTVTIFGILDGADAQTVPPGTYTETVVLSIEL